MILLYPGSFDPVTFGHIDIAMRGAKLAHKLVVGVLDNHNKHALFTVMERLMFFNEAFQGDENIEVGSFSGLLTEYATQIGADAILRGIRTSGDFETEARYATNNLAIGGIETVFVPSNPQLSHISSSIVKEIAMFSQGNQALEAMVPPLVYKELNDKMDNNRK